MKSISHYLKRLRRDGIHEMWREVKRRIPLQWNSSEDCFDLKDSNYLRRDLNRQKRRYREIIRNIEIDQQQGCSVGKERITFGKEPIWFLWFQGMDGAPDVIGMCYRQLNYIIDKYHSDRFEVHLLTDENLADYVDLSFVTSGREWGGHFTAAHFSDIIRAELLYVYGGIWIDSTVFVTGPLPSYAIESGLFYFQGSPAQLCVTTMSSWFIRVRLDDDARFLWGKMRQLLAKYWQEHRHLDNYLLFHLMWQALIDDNERVAKYVERECPYVCNSQSRVLGLSLRRPYNETEFLTWCRLTTIHKLSYKNNRDIAGSYYNFLISEYRKGKKIDIII